MSKKYTDNDRLRLTYAQDWPTYNKAQCSEKPLFMRLLAGHCGQIEQPTYKFGRPTLSLADMAFCSVFKVYSLFSGRRFSGDIRTANEKGYIDRVPHFNSVFNYLKKPELTPILKDMITKSSSALRAVESDFAVDSTGFSTSQFARWFHFKYGKERNDHVWLKAHVMCGVKTNIVTSVEITNSLRNDSTQFKELVSRTAENFTLREVSADKAYSSRLNLKHVSDLGGTPYIPFRKHTTSRAARVAIWHNMWYMYNLHKEEFMQHYHKRSNVETTMHMIKSKFGSRLRSKDKTGQVNELLAKVLCHNICVVIQEMYELGLSSDF